VNHYLKNWQDGYSNTKEDANIAERKYDAEKLLDIKILKSFETYGMSGLGRLCSFQKSIYSIGKLS
jgi:hypothetical protein